MSELVKLKWIPFVAFIIALFSNGIATSPVDELDELSPQENNCTRSSLSGSIVCARIPLFCRNVCDTAKRLDFDSSLTRISPFSFGSYQIKQTMELNFRAGGLARIETDAFNGLVIESDTQLEINIDYAYLDGLEEQDIDQVMPNRPIRCIYIKKIN